MTKTPPIITATQATPTDADAVLDLLVDAARWIQSTGIAQWERFRSYTSAAREEVEEAIARSETYLFRQGDQAVGTISLAPPGDWDRNLWGAAEAEEALFVHRLAVARSAAGQGIGGIMLDWATAQARAVGVRHLRLDCVGENAALNAYYGQRFAFKGQSPARGALFSKYERVLAEAAD
ncbi:MAG: GNAT family N-acetyltransferase [Mycobacterium leprae]